MRELIRQRVFDNPAGSAFRLPLAYPWLRVMRLNSSSLDLQLVTGRIVDRATGFDKLRRRGPANEAGVSAVRAARLHALLSRTEARVPSV